MSNHGKFWWNELVSRDVEASRAFYREVIGWQYDDVPMPGGTYTLAKGPGAEAPLGGMHQMPAEWGEAPSQWIAYIAVDDVDAAVAKAEAAGGIVHGQPFDVPDVGRIAILGDPQGTRIGIIAPADHG